MVEPWSPPPAGIGLDYVGGSRQRFPADMGVVVALLLNHVRLSPDEAIWMPAGNLHAYLRGTGVEVLASSDNVLRGGFTAKRSTSTSCSRVLRFEVLADPVVKPVRGRGRRGDVAGTGSGVRAAASRAAPGCRRLTSTAAGPRIVFCEHGRRHARRRIGAAMRLSAGQAAFGRRGPATVGQRRRRRVRRDHRPLSAALQSSRRVTVTCGDDPFARALTSRSPTFARFARLAKMFRIALTCRQRSVTL